MLNSTVSIIAVGVGGQIKGCEIHCRAVVSSGLGYRSHKVGLASLVGVTLYVSHPSTTVYCFYRFQQNKIGVSVLTVASRR